MVAIKPFSAVHYNLEKADFSKAIMPPYDIIEDADIQEYYAKDKHNIIRIDKGLEYKKDNGSNNKYTRAGEYLNEWLKNRILLQDEKESLYLYAQEYSMPDGQRKEMLSLMCLVKAEDFKNRTILPHEKTHKGPKIDRLNLIRACNANTSPIFSLYSDSGNKIDSMLRKAAKKKPFIAAKDDKGNAHRVWRIDDKAAIEIQALLRNRQIFIADGHHRYETALAFRNEMRKKPGAKKGEEMPYDFTMMCLAGMEHSGISVLAPHRIICNLNFDIDKTGADKFFRISKIKSREELKSGILKNKNKCIGIVQNGRFLLLELKEKEYKSSIKDRKQSSEYSMLSVSMLHDLLFSRILKIPEEKIMKNIRYVEDLDKAIKFGLADKTASFLIQPVRIEYIKTICLNGEIMPHKSTYFLPKLSTGILIYKMA